jgi:hypothetical protein
MNGKQIGEDWRDGDSQVWTIALAPDKRSAIEKFLTYTS